MVVAMILSNTLQFQCFWNLNKCLWAIFSQTFWKLMAISFGWGCYGSKFLQTIISHLLKSVNLSSELSSHQMYSKVLRQFSKGSLILISSESSKILLLIKVLYRHIWFNLCRRYFWFHALNVSSCYWQQLYNECRST